MPIGIGTHDYRRDGHSNCSHGTGDHERGASARSQPARWGDVVGSRPIDPGRINALNVFPGDPESTLELAAVDFCDFA
ncbi:MAG: hypothetical protein ACOYO2_06930 [Mycobacterium sp.]